MIPLTRRCLLCSDKVVTELNSVIRCNLRKCKQMPQFYEMEFFSFPFLSFPFLSFSLSLSLWFSKNKKRKKNKRALIVNRCLPLPIHWNISAHIHYEESKKIRVSVSALESYFIIKYTVLASQYRLSVPTSDTYSIYYQRSRT